MKLVIILMLAASLNAGNENECSKYFNKVDPLLKLAEKESHKEVPNWGFVNEALRNMQNGIKCIKNKRKKMSTITTVNLKIVFKDNVPKDIEAWLFMNNFENVIKTDAYENFVPSYIMEKANRCYLLTTKDDEDGVFYYDPIKKELVILRSHKNKDNDWERFVNFLMPFIDKEKSLGFISNDYTDEIRKIIFEESDSKDDLVTLSVVTEVMTSVVDSSEEDEGSGYFLPETLGCIEDDIEDLAKLEVNT